MATAEELLNSISKNQVSVLSEDDGIFVIDGESRTITVPDSERLFGVEGDKDVERKYFRCPKIVGDNIDLSQHQIYVSYVFTTTENNTIFPTIGNGLYHCEDVEVSGDNITFSWLLSGNVFANPGFIAFKVMAKKSEGSELKTKWNTAPAIGTVLLTVPDGEEIAEEYPDIINQLLTKMESVEQIATPEAMQEYVNAYLEENPVTGGMTAEQEQQLNKNTEDISSLSEDISNIAEVHENIILLVGVGAWSNNKFNLIQDDKNRLTADISQLNLKVGDKIGLKNYSTYRIAIGQNNPQVGWIGGYAGIDTILTEKNYTMAKVIVIKRADEADITDADIKNIYDLFFTTNKNKKAYLKGKSVSKENLNFKLYEVSRNYIHLSFDDIEFCLKNLIENSDSFSSIFEEPFLKKLKELHDNYGACFSLYVWKCSSILANVTNKYSKEFIENSDWLKFGFHADRLQDYSNANKEQIETDYNNFISKIIILTGGINSIDRIPRLNMFKGNKEVCESMRDCDCGIYGLLSADDTRETYYLSENQRSYLRNHSKLYDLNTGLVFYSSNMRLDWFNDNFSSSYDYNVPTKKTPYDELKYLYEKKEYGDLFQPLIVFTHEWEVYSNNYVLNEKIDRVEQVCKFASDYNFTFDFPMNKEHGGIASIVIQ